MSKFRSSSEVFNSVFDENNNTLRMSISGLTGGGGTDGTSGVDGTSGTDGTSGINGINGTSGISGTDGTSGVDGQEGLMGPEGPAGMPGMDGQPGADGLNGVDGQDGTSGTSGIDAKLYDYNNVKLKIDYNSILKNNEKLKSYTDSKNWSNTQGIIPGISRNGKYMLHDCLLYVYNKQIRGLNLDDGSGGSLSMYIKLKSAISNNSEYILSISGYFSNNYGRSFAQTQAMDMTFQDVKMDESGKLLFLIHSDLNNHISWSDNYGQTFKQLVNNDGTWSLKLDVSSNGRFIIYTSKKDEWKISSNYGKSFSSHSDMFTSISSVSINNNGTVLIYGDFSGSMLSKIYYPSNEAPYEYTYSVSNEYTLDNNDIPYRVSNNKFIYVLDNNGTRTIKSIDIPVLDSYSFLNFSDDLTYVYWTSHPSSNSNTDLYFSHSGGLNNSSIKIGTDSNNATLSQTEGLRYKGTTTVWRDMIGDLFSKKLNNTNGKVDYDWNNNAIIFQSGGSMSNVVDRVQMNIEINHDMLVGDSISFNPHIHWFSTITSGNQLDYKLQLDYRLQRNGQAKTDTWTSIYLEDGDNDQFNLTTDGTYNQISKFPSITINCGISDTLQFRMTRTDSSTGDMLIYFMDIHGQVDSDGSDDEFTKNY